MSLRYLIFRPKEGLIIESVRGALVAQARLRSLEPGHLVTREGSVLLSGLSWVSKRSDLHEPYEVPCLDCREPIVIDPLRRATPHVVCLQCRESRFARAMARAPEPDKESAPPTTTDATKASFTPFWDRLEKDLRERAIEAYEERAAIMEYDGELSRQEAERAAYEDLRERASRAGLLG